MPKTGKSILTAAWAMLALAALTYADVTVTAKVNTNDITLSGTLTLIIEVSGTTNPGGAPELNIPNFTVQHAGQTVSYQWINGQSSSLVGYNYALTPTKTGTLTIPSLTATIDGKTYATQPITVVVHDDAAPATGGAYNSGAGHSAVSVPTEGLKSIFMTASVDSSKVYVGQQILLRVQFLRRPDVRLASQARYNAPDTTGFLVKALPQKEFTTTLNGAEYQVTELPYSLFPTSDGEFAIGSANVTLAVQTMENAFDPNSFFQNFFGRTQTIQLNTRAIPIHVRALPKNKPLGFSGAVGRYKMTARTDATQYEVGKPFNLIVTIEGVGNIESLKEPPLPELKGFRRYESIANTKINKEGKFLSGSKEFKILLIPQVSGPATLPAIPFVYFNPDESDFVNESSDPITLQVKPGTLSSSSEAVSGISNAPNENTQPQQGVQVLDKDIRFIKTSGTVKPISPPLYRSGFFRIFNLFPPLFAFVAFLIRHQSTLRVKNAALYRSKGAERQAQRLLKAAKKKIKDPHPIPFYNALHTALSGYLADKLGLAASGLLWDDVDRRLQEKNITADVRARIRGLFDEADMARFATSSFTDDVREKSLSDIQNVIRDLEKTL